MSETLIIEEMIDFLPIIAISMVGFIVLFIVRGFSNSSPYIDDEDSTFSFSSIIVMVIVTIILFFVGALILILAEVSNLESPIIVGPSADDYIEPDYDSDIYYNPRQQQEQEPISSNVSYETDKEKETKEPEKINYDNFYDGTYENIYKR